MNIQATSQKPQNARPALKAVVPQEKPAEGFVAKADAFVKSTGGSALVGGIAGAIPAVGALSNFVSSEASFQSQHTGIGAISGGVAIMGVVANVGGTVALLVGNTGIGAGLLGFSALGSALSWAVASEGPAAQNYGRPPSK